MAGDKHPPPTAENSGGTAVVRARKPPPGRPFKPAQSGNPGGRPKSDGWRAENRAAASIFLQQLVKKALEGKMQFGELVSSMSAAATNGGYLNEGDLVTLDARRLQALGDILAREHLSEQQRTKIIDDFQARLAVVKHEDP